MSAQIFTFPGNDGQPVPAEATPEFYARVASGIVANCSSYNLDPMVLAGAIVAVVETGGLRTAALDLIAKAEREPIEPVRPLPAYCDPSNEFRGAKYDRDLDVAEIAKLLRKDIATARADGSLALPEHAKVSVRIDRYSMGCAIYAQIKGLTEAEMYNAPGTGDTNGYPYNGGSTPMREAAENKVKELMDAYLRNNSDSMTDYYDVNFSGRVSTYND